MWSRRAQEYEAKINSGDIVAIAEVVRDLFRSDTQPEQSYSERQLYEAALDGLSREIAAVQRITETEAIKEIEAALALPQYNGRFVCTFRNDYQEGDQRQGFKTNEFVVVARDQVHEVSQGARSFGPPERTMAWTPA